MHVDEVLTGFAINLIAEALLHHRGGRLALAEAVQLHGRSVQSHGTHNGGLDLLGLGSDVDLFLHRGNIFDSVFHRSAPSAWFSAASSGEGTA